jgi:hypothetical protein
MKFIFLFSITFFIISCGTPAVNETKTDQFRENALRLSRAGLLKNYQGEKLDSMLAVYQKDSVNGLKELLVASGDLLKIHVTLNGRKLDEVYQKICDTIGMRYPELKADEVQTVIIPSVQGGNDTDWVVVKVRFGETWYERKLYYFDNWQVDDFVYRIYNRKLADDGKQQRLHLVEYTCVNCRKKSADDFMGNTDVTRYGYLMLTKAQEDSLNMIPALEMESENEFNIYTTAQMNEELKKFEASGLVEEIGTKWYEGAKADVMQSSIYQQTDFYDFFDTLFSYTVFDTSNSYNPYEEMLASLAKVSRGNFEPTNIVDEEINANTRKVRFTFEKDIYEFEAKENDRFLFPGIIDNVNKALADHQKGGAFYTISTNDAVCMLIYLDDDKVEKVKASGFFMLLEKGPSQEMKDKWGHSVVAP